MSAWGRAARDLAAFREGVVNALDVDGYPISVRQLALRYDAEAGTLPLVLPESLRPAAGPASLLAHLHDDKLWNLRAMLIKGRIEPRGDGWIFVSTEYKPRSQWDVLKDARRSAEQYLTKRGLVRPKIAYDAVHRLQREARAIKDP